ncbi:DMT family transporter [Daejeonella oryzae]|uniref:DMT family transporter n=1 Tax=Daejeonella oryzae TaxID=1122943 RepID=UPI000415047B|nr:EamA family transporter [Daejeonella oryzae]
MLKNPNLKLIIAVISIAFFWGTTFLGIRIGVETIPPILVTGLRNILAGSILLGFLLISRKFEWMTWPRLRRNLIISFMMIVLANGLTTYAEVYISSGLASLISTLSPLCVLLLNLAFGHEKLSWKIILGVFLGICGMYLIYQNNIADLFNPEYRLGIMAILFAVLMWASGTIFTKKSAMQPGNMFMNLCVQMLFAGVFMLLLQLVIQPDIHSESWSLRSILAVIYLAIFGSLVGYVAYTYALSKLPSTKVSIITYINVVVALSLGWLILDEKLSVKIIMAAVLIIGGVVIANLRKRMPVAIPTQPPLPPIIE